MKTFFAYLFLLITVAKAHYFCPTTNLVILQNEDKSPACDIPRHLLITLIELDDDGKIPFLADNITNQTIFDTAPTEPTSCKDFPDCDVNWSIPSNGKVSIDIKLQTAR